MLRREFERVGLGYVLRVPEALTELAVDHLTRSRAELHGELAVDCGLPGTRSHDGHLHRARFNLSSTTARTTLAKVLATRSAGDIDWLDLLEDLCRRVLAAEREGNPIQKVGNLPTRPAEIYRIAPLMPAGKTTIVYGAGGTGKSYLACAMAVSVMTGHGFLGFPVTPAPVLYLDWETDAYEIDERVKRVSRGYRIAPPDIHYRACAGPFEDVAEDAARFVSEKGIGLVVIDSVGMASATGREGSDANESTLRLFTGLRYLDTTVLAIDHVAGADLEKVAVKPYGSIYKVNLARSVFELRQAQDETHLGLYHRKVNGGRLEKPIGIHVAHVDDEVTFTKEELTETDLVAATTNSARIERALRTGPALTVEELAEATGINRDTVRTTLNRGRHTQFAKTDDGRWGLLYDGAKHVSQHVTGGTKHGTPPLGGEFPVVSDQGETRGDVA